MCERYSLQEGRIFVKVQPGFQSFSRNYARNVKYFLHVMFYVNGNLNYEYASAVMMDIIFLGIKQCDAIFKVRITRVFSVRKSDRVQQLYILLILLLESNLQCNFTHQIFFIIMIDDIAESFRYFLFQAWGVVAVARQAKPEKS